MSFFIFNQMTEINQYGMAGIGKFTVYDELNFM